MNENIFDKFPIIKTERLVLRQIVPSDVHTIFKIYSNPDVIKYFGKDLFKSVEEAENNINNLTVAFNTKEGIRWGISMKGHTQLIGTIGYWKLIKKHFRAEVGYDLLPEYWRTGIMHEAFKALIEFAFTEMNLHSIEANVDPRNTASAMLLEKLNFKKEGYFKENFFYDGKFLDSAIYSLLNSK